MDKDTANIVADAVTQAGIGSGGASQVCKALNARLPDVDWAFEVVLFKDPDEGLVDWTVMITTKNEGE